MQLSLGVMQKQLDDERAVLDSMKVQIEDAKVKKLEEIQAQWDGMKDKLKAVIEEELAREEGIFFRTCENVPRRPKLFLSFFLFDLVFFMLEAVEQDSEEQNAEEPQENHMPWDQMSEILKMYLTEGKYGEAFKLCKMSGRENEEFKLFG